MQHLPMDSQFTRCRCGAAYSTTGFRVRSPSPSLSTGSTAHVTSLSFTSGFLLGQLSVVILFGAFIKFFIFGEAPPADASGSRRAPPLGAVAPGAHRRSGSVTYAASPSPARRGLSSPSDAHGAAAAPPPRPAAPPPAQHIPAKTYYDVHAHPPESLDWCNVLVAQALAQLRADAAADGALRRALTALLNGPRRPAFCERIAVTDVDLGAAFPLFSNCRVRPVAATGADEDGDEWGGGKGGGGRLQAHMDVDLSDCLSLGVETTLVLNYPRPRTAVLPVALRVEVARFAGTLSISFLPASASATTGPASTADNPPSTPPPTGGAEDPGPGGGGGHGRTPTTLAFAFAPDYTLALSTRSLLGARSRLQDVPKIAQLVEARLRAWFEERCVAPRAQRVVVPSLWPRMRNTTVAAAGAAGEGDGGAEGWGASPPRRKPRESAGEAGGAWPALDADDVGREWEGLRRRARGAEGTGVSGEGFEMPGSMPGMLVT